MFANLKKHEEGHGKYAVDAAKEIVKKKCKGAKRTISQMHRQNRAYDRRTDHGRKQGVILK